MFKKVQCICMKYWITACSQACAGKSVVRQTDHVCMTIAVDWDAKQQTKQTKTKQLKLIFI